MNTRTARSVGRNAAVAVSVGALMLSLAACSQNGSESESGSQQVTFVGYGGETQESQLVAFGEPFTEETGIQVLSDSPTDYAKLKAMVDSGNVTWDAVLMTRAGVVEYCGTLLEELPADLLADVPLVEGVESTPCSIPLYISQSMFVANNDTYGEDGPTEIADFFDTEKYPGKRLLPPEFDSGMMEFALLADGVAPEDLYPIDVDRALAKYDTIRDSLVFAESYPAMGQAMLDGTVDMAQTVESRFGYLLRDGANWSAVWDQTILTPDQVGIPKGSKNMDAAVDFLRSTLEAGPQNTHGELTGRQSTIETAEPAYEDYQREALVLEDPDNRGNVIWLNSDWWGENLDEMTKKYTAWQIG
ncbi:extracellular solute-binding protein [Microbacterium profundi]